MSVLADGRTPIPWGGDLDTMDVTGQLAPMKGDYTERWGAEGQPAADYGWIGRDAKGVWLTIHPETVLLEAPAEVAEVYETLRRHPELTRADQDTLAAADYVLAEAFCAARAQVLAQARQQAAEESRRGK